MEDIFRLLDNNLSSKLLAKVYKQAKQFRCMLTAVIQNAGDLFVGSEPKAILPLSRFVIIMSQLKCDRELLQKNYNISPDLMTYISDGKPGDGLLYDGATEELFPFTDLCIEGGGPITRHLSGKPL